MLPPFGYGSRLTASGLFSSQSSPLRTCGSQSSPHKTSVSLRSTDYKFFFHKSKKKNSNPIK